VDRSVKRARAERTRTVNATWRTIRRSLINLLRRPATRLRFKEMKEEAPVLRPWHTPRQVASFLSRRTSRLDRRKEVLRALLRVVAVGGSRAEVAATILLLAGALSIDWISARRGGGSPPSLPFVLILGHPATSLAKERPLAAVHLPMLPVLGSVSRTLALAEVAQ
jgi:hypothetical protein